ncbi:unnamed protein product [Spirodela intermedia]|uniref:Uncharacterized protein n=1 Tax=Spirodela intermedia TaxID=51605 RepID=A0A7I8J0F3_SPIIN|nr:unnamed protein product [Spirodela intermedia]CAA6663696.1 unnamed protein product [Spirodela intermedia]
MEKTPDEIYNLYENLSENSRDQASFELYDRDKKRGIYELHHEDDSKLRNERVGSGSEAQSGSSREQGSSGLLGSIGARSLSCCTNLRMKLPNTRLTSIQPLSVG